MAPPTVLLDHLTVDVILRRDDAVGIGDGGRPARVRVVLAAVGVCCFLSLGVGLGQDSARAVVGVGVVVTGVGPTALAVGHRHGEHEVVACRSVNDVTLLMGRSPRSGSPELS